MNELDKLQQLLTQLPGIGPRQARRFAYFFMQTSNQYVFELSETINQLRSKRHRCSACNRIFFESISHHDTQRCPTCSDPARDTNRLLILLKQADFEQVQASEAWNGQYFVINRNIKLSDKNPEKLLPIEALTERIQSAPIEEVVFGLPVNPEGEYITEVLQKQLQNLAQEKSISFSLLGRGLSSGSELEYSDPQTLKSALQNRS